MADCRQVAEPTTIRKYTGYSRRGGVGGRGAISLVFDITYCYVAFFDLNEWISTSTHAMIVFDDSLLNIGVFDREEGFSTDED